MFAGGGAGADSCKDRGSRKPLVAQSYELFRVSAPWRKEGCRTCTSGSDYDGERSLLPFLKMFSRLMTLFLESTPRSLPAAEISKERWVSEKLASWKFGGAFLFLFVCSEAQGRPIPSPGQGTGRLPPLVPHPSPSPLHQKGGACFRLSWETRLLRTWRAGGLLHSRVKQQKSGSLFPAY